MSATDEQIERPMQKRSKHGGEGRTKYATHLKRWKSRKERRRAKQDPECPSKYRKYRGHEY